MIVQLLLGLLADFVFESAVAAGRSYQADVSRYLEQRGFIPDSRPKPVPVN
jgi:hypothetical protein